MADGWGGGTPVQFTELGESRELAVTYTANDDIIISGIRVWSGLTAVTSGRKGRIWTTGGTLTTDVAMADSLPGGGWTTYTLASPLNINDGEQFLVSYDTISYYGAVTSAFPQNSADLALTATAGKFATSRGIFPTNASGAFFGIDVVYTINTGGNVAPVVEGIVLTSSDATVNGVATITDETPATVTLNWNWGDGTSTNTLAGVVTAQHTYTASGNYAVLVTATDSAGETGTAARAITITVGVGATANEEWLTDILDAVVSDVQATGYFDKVNTHEPKRAPRTGLTAAVWVFSIDPLPAASGLAATSALLVFTLRLFTNMLQEPQDAIDPKMLKAASNILRRYHDDFDIGGIIRNIDLLGSQGVALRAQAGYLEIDKAQFRVIDITVPCIVNDVWPQVN